jgi:hypothetical protein
MVEALNGTVKAELIDRCGPWKTRTQTEIAIYEWISWYNYARIHTSIGDLPPVEYELMTMNRAAAMERRVAREGVVVSWRLIEAPREPQPDVPESGCTKFGCIIPVAFPLTTFGSTGTSSVRCSEGAPVFLSQPPIACSFLHQSFPVAISVTGNVVW